MIIAVNILGADEGFLPKALMLANPDEAMIAQGPRIQKKKIRIIEMSRFISFFHNDRYLIQTHFNNTALDLHRLLINNHIAGQKP